tara:strand:- start:777 stop:1064 length:288 start_codon:yes stop_codon:yes gene_type:complete
MGVKRGDILANYQWLNTICSEWPKEYVEIARYLVLNREEKYFPEMMDEAEVQFETILLYVDSHISGPGLMPGDKYNLMEYEMFGPDVGTWEIINP